MIPKTNVPCEEISYDRSFLGPLAVRPPDLQDSGSVLRHD
jgi:hypothetical protein